MEDGEDGGDGRRNGPRRAVMGGDGPPWPRSSPHRADPARGGPAAAAVAEKVGRGRDWRRADGDEEAAMAVGVKDPRLLLLEDEGAAQICPATPLLHRIRAGPGATTADRGDGADATGGGRGSGTVGGRRRRRLLRCSICCYGRWKEEKSTCCPRERRSILPGGSAGETGWWARSTT